ncbi:MAG: ParB/RepB/Spo0J family partition protein [Butyricicoccus pullicaecorum]|nr:ParB/RepB/Spo0J family partition protein [Butyricicoccus pullicaecorum]
MAKAKGGLGKGFGALLGESLMAAEEESGGVSTLPMTLVEPNREQPRKRFSPETMQELTRSIEMHGVVTPITVRKTENGYYQIIAGERRWRAARSAGLTEIPALVIEADDKTVMELALIENLQREDLNPIEEAQGYHSLMEEYGLTQEQVAERVGRSRPAVANALRLLSLPDEAQELLADGTLSAGHARAVLAIKDEALRTHDVLEKMAGMSVRQAEKYAKSLQKEPELQSEPDQPAEFQPDYTAALAERLEHTLGRRVRIEQGKSSGTVSLAFYGDDDLERLVAALETLSV